MTVVDGLIEHISEISLMSEFAELFRLANFFGSLASCSIRACITKHMVRACIIN